MSGTAELRIPPRTGAQPAPMAAPRLHYIDWLRAAAIVGVFVYHTLHPFDAEDWHVKNAETSGLISIPMAFFWSFGLAVLFLLAGAGVRFALRKRSWRTFVRERTLRLFVPFLVGTVLLSPVQAFLEANNNGTYQGSLTDFLAAWSGGVVETVLRGASPTVFGIGYHLWFLGFLFAISLVALPLCIALARRRGRAALDALARRAAVPGSSLVFGLPILVLVIVAFPFGTREHDWLEFGWYFGYFMTGYVLFSDERFLAAIRRDVRIALGVGVVSAVVMIAIAGELATLGDRTLDIPTAGLLAVFGIEGWAWTLVALNIGMRAKALQRPVGAWVGDAVLPVYVLHQPVILAVAFFVVAWPMGIVPKWIVVFGASAAITLALVGLALRTPIARILLGARARPAGAAREVAAQEVAAQEVAAQEVAASRARFTPLRKRYPDP